MRDSDKVRVTLMFLDAIRKGSTGPEADHPANRPFSAHAVGLCDIIEAILRDGDPQRAVELAKDMPLRMQLAGVRDSR